MLLDFVKVFVYKHWSFDMTAKMFPTNSRRAEVVRRNGRKIIKARIDRNFDRVRAQSKMIWAAKCFVEAGKARGVKEVAKVSEDKSTLGK
jgi:H+-transporting ATPase